jgi:hypothetical protein
VANDVTMSPLIIDTPASPVGVISGHVTSIYWYNPTTVGHAAVVQDENNRDLARFRCEVANQSQVLHVDRGVVVLNVPTLDSGVLYIYMRTAWPRGGAG